MRPLSSFEKRLLGKMIEISKQPEASNNIMNLLDEDLEGVRLSVNREERTAQLMFEVHGVGLPTLLELQQITSRVTPLMQLIISAINLIQYLEKEGYVILFRRVEFPSNVVEFGRGATNVPYQAFPIPDAKVVEFLIQGIELVIIVVEPLIQYVKDGYRTPEDRRHQQNLKWTRIGVVVAFVVGVLPAILSYSDDWTIDANQFAAIQSEYKTLNKNVHTIASRMDSIAQSDTIKIMVDSSAQSKAWHSK
jgi:hypothetical protein